ncbi:MAG: hypothetical protein LBU24_05030 [Methanocalculaceae archaeon]|nr:hypothetical protein [Methanocalculaceae archaeon]
MVEIAGQEVSTDIRETIVSAGNAKLLTEAGISVPESVPVETVIYVAGGGSYAGCIIFADTLRPHPMEAAKQASRQSCKHSTYVVWWVPLPCRSSSIFAIISEIHAFTRN